MDITTFIAVISFLSLITIFLLIIFMYRKMNSVLSENQEQDQKKYLEELPKNIASILTQLNSIEKVANNASSNASAAVGAVNATAKGTVEFQKNIIEQSKGILNVLTNPTDSGKIGEISLENFLEKSDLPAQHYHTQKIFKFGSETYKPDAVIDIPGNTKIIIDAKTNSKKWIEAFEAEDAEEKELLVEECVKKVIDTAKDLSFKPYDQLQDTIVPNMVVMYIPIDTIYLELLKRKGSSFFDDAYVGFKKQGTRERGTPVIFTTPSLIGGLLRVIIWLWRERNAYQDQAELVKKLRDFRDDLRTFIENFEKGAKNHKIAGDSFKKAYGNLAQLNELLGSMKNYVSTDEIKEFNPDLASDLDQDVVND